MNTHALGRRYSIHALDWRLFVPYWLLISLILFNVLFSDPSGLSEVVPFWLAAVVVYIVVVVVVGQLRPRIHLYENGVIALDKGKQSIWTWDELTHFKGTRHSYGSNGIAFWNTGANDFYAGDTFAFRVGAFTGQANILVEYILSRMAEKHIPAHVAAIRAGETREFDRITIHLQGLNDDRWQQIKSLRFDNEGMAGMGYRVLADVEGQRFARHLGDVDGIGAYILMGVVDALRGTDYLRTRQEEIPFWWRRWWRFTRTTGWKLALIFGAFALIVPDRDGGGLMTQGEGFSPKILSESVLMESAVKCGRM
jgi:hypothetical protein